MLHKHFFRILRDSHLAYTVRFSISTSKRLTPAVVCTDKAWRDKVGRRTLKMGVHCTRNTLTRHKLAYFVASSISRDPFPLFLPLLKFHREKDKQGASLKRVSRFSIKTLYLLFTHHTFHWKLLTSTDPHPKARNVHELSRLCRCKSIMM